MSRKYGKLVRDKIPDRIRTNGEEPITRILNTQELILAVFDKDVEEAKEARRARTHRQLMDELADKWETFRTLLRLKKISFKRVRKAAKAKRTSHGGFKKGIFLIGVKPKKKM